MLYAGFSAAAKVDVICTYERLMMRPGGEICRGFSRNFALDEAAIFPAVGGEIWRDFLWD